MVKEFQKLNDIYTRIMFPLVQVQVRGFLTKK